MVEAESSNQDLQTNELREIKTLTNEFFEKLNPFLKSRLDDLEKSMLVKLNNLSNDLTNSNHDSLNEIKLFCENESQKLNSLKSTLEGLVTQIDPQFEELKAVFETKLERKFNIYKKESVRLLERLLQGFDDIKTIFNKFEEEQGRLSQEIKKISSRKHRSPTILSILFPKPKKHKIQKKSVFSLFRKIQVLLDSNTTTTLQLRKKLNELRKSSKLHEKNYLLTRKIYKFEKILSLEEGILLNFTQKEKCLQLLKQIQVYLKPNPVQSESQKEPFESPLRNLRKKIKYHITGIELLYILKDIKKVLDKYTVNYELLEEFSKINGYCKLIGENEIKRQNFKQILTIIKKWDEILKKE